MEPNQTNVQPKTSAKDFFLNLGAIVALYTTIIALLNLLFTIIDSAYPQITPYYYASTSSISFPVATLIIFFPIFILLMWLLEKSYAAEPDKKHLGVRRWLTYITLFIAGLTLAGDLVTVLYYFLDGQELTTGFLLKVLSVLIVAGLVFLYYISDVRKTLTTHEKRSWFLLSLLIILASIVWGFIVLGSPWTQQQIKYDEQKVSDLQNINSSVISYYNQRGNLPNSLSDLSSSSNDYYAVIPVDGQTGKSYDYNLTGAISYELCATFNKDSQNNGAGMNLNYYYGPTNASWDHPVGRYCFTQTVTKEPVAYPQTSTAPVVK